MPQASHAERVEWPDLLRGVAAFAVVLFHVRVTLWVGFRALNEGTGYSPLDRAMSWLTLPFPWFGTAVMLFFVVSGFAIHFPYAGHDSPPAWRSYAVRRFFRLYPPYAVAVLATMFAEWLVVGLIDAPSSSPSKVGATLAMVQNYAAPIGQMAGNPSLWSLPVEVELYAAYPLLLWFWRRAGTAAMLACVAAVSAAAAMTLLSGQQWAMGNFAKYWILWASGAALAESFRTGTLPRWRPWHGYLAAGVLILAVLARVAAVPFGVEHFIWGGLYLLVLLWGLNRPALPAALPPAVRRVMLFLGDISYSLYLVHYPLLLVMGAAWIAVFGAKPTNVLIPLLASLVPIPFAYVLWRLVERPSQACGRALARGDAPVPGTPVSAA